MDSLTQKSEEKSMHYKAIQTNGTYSTREKFMGRQKSWKTKILLHSLNVLEIVQVRRLEEIQMWLCFGKCWPWGKLKGWWCSPNLTGIRKILKKVRNSNTHASEYILTYIYAQIYISTSTCAHIHTYTDKQTHPHTQTNRLCNKLSICFLVCLFVFHGIRTAIIKENMHNIQHDRHRT